MVVSSSFPSVDDHRGDVVMSSEECLRVVVVVVVRLSVHVHFNMGLSPRDS